MKLYLFGLLLFTTTSLFGSVSASPALPPVSVDQRTLISISGTVDSVVINGAPSLGGPESTEITLGFLIDCTQKLENFSYLVDNSKGGSLKIIASALVSEVKLGEDMMKCMGISYHTEVIVVTDAYQESDIDLEFLKLIPVSPSSLEIPASTEAVTAIDDINVDSVTALCPAGARCVTDGTVITLSTYIPCVNRIAGYNYRTQQVGDEIHVQMFAAEYQDSKKVACAEQKVTFTLSAVMQFADDTSKIRVDLLGPASDPITLPANEVQLDAGEYLVQIAQSEFCSPGEFNVKQFHQYEQGGVNLDLTIILDFDKRIFDNWMRAAVCMAGANTGVAVINLSKKTTIKASSSTQITMIEKITTRDELLNQPEVNLQGGHDYVIEMESEGMCRNNIAFLNSYIWFAAAQGARANDVTTYSASSFLEDNLVKPLGCAMLGQVNKSFEYVSVGKANDMTVKADYTLKEFKINKVRTITTRTPVAAKGSVD